MSISSPIITSLLDLDLYKLTMLQAVYHQFSDVNVEYEFICRNKDVDLSIFKDEIEQEIMSLSKLTFQIDEIDYLKEIRFIKKDFVDFLRIFRLQPEEFINVFVDNGKFRIIISGPWLHTILFETLILSIINEVYFRNQKVEFDLIKEGTKRVYEKCCILKDAPIGFAFSDFGTRRRFSKSWHELILPSFIKTGKLVGTSNVFFAKKFNITPIGTMAHEFLQAGMGMIKKTALVNSQKFMLDAWAKEYRGDLGIALTDTIGIDAFLNDFDMFFAKLFDGCRHDSGDPYSWGEKIIKHYESMNIDPKTKTAIFSDGLDIPKAIDIFNHFKGRIKTGFGIGTNITNDVGINPINIVIKMVSCNGKPVAKISDEPEKAICKDPLFFDYLCNVFNVEI